MIKAGIAGVTGYTGIELVRLITGHPAAKLCGVSSNTHTGRSLTDVFPSMRGFEDLVCGDLLEQARSLKPDLLFLALPHKISMEFVPELLDLGIKVVDLSADFRFKDAAAYEAAYQPHTAGHLLAESVYGLCEIFRQEIASARIIGNPGCYPTSILLPLIPLLKEGLILSEGIVADSKSGVSGAGRGLSLSSHFCEVNESFTPYKVGNHRHTPEINEILTRQSGKQTAITFVPHLLPLTRGMMSTIYVQAAPGTRERHIRETYAAYYGNAPFVRILGPAMFPAVSWVKGTNCCDIGIHCYPDSGQIILVSAIDNLIKGASGQAVQNMNLMFGLEEKTGLDQVQVPL